MMRNAKEEHNVWKSRRQWKTSPDIHSAAVGIDLGTSNSCVAVWDTKNHRTRVLRCEGDDTDEEEGYETFPSVVSFAFDEQQRRPVVAKVGRRATIVKNSSISLRAVDRDSGVVRNVKRILGVEPPDSKDRMK